MILMKFGFYGSSGNYVAISSLAPNSIMALIAAIFELFVRSMSKRKLSFDVIKFLITWSVLWVILFVFDLNSTFHFFKIPG